MCQGTRRKLLTQIILNWERENLLCIQSLSVLKNRCHIHGLAGHEEKETDPAKIYRPFVVLDVTLLVRNVCLSVDISGRYLPAAIFQKLNKVKYSHFEPSPHSDENHSPVLRYENFVVTKTLRISV